MSQKGGSTTDKDTKKDPNAAADTKKPHPETDCRAEKSTEVADCRAEKSTGDIQEMSDEQVAFLEEKFATQTLIDPATESELLENMNQLDGPTMTMEQIRKWWKNKRYHDKMKHADGEMSGAQVKVLAALFKQNRSLQQHHSDGILKALKLSDPEGADVTYAMVQKWWNKE